MARDRKDIPQIATFADHEVITPPQHLAKAITCGPIDDDPVARAERALGELAAEFSGWMESECERLEAARRRIWQFGLGPDNRDALFRAAHDIKGEAATFGFPLIAAVAESLCRLLEEAANPAALPLKLIDQHVDAVRAILREHNSPHAEALARELARRLREVTLDFLQRENRKTASVVPLASAKPAD